MKPLILTSILILTSLVYVSECEAARGTRVLVPTTEAHTINHDWCDAMFSALRFEEVPPSIHLECKSRFRWNINREKASMRAYGKRLNTFIH